MERRNMLDRSARVLCFIGLVVASACGDGVDLRDTEDTVLEPSLAPVSAQCDARSVARSARDYFVRPEQQIASAAISDMEAACTDGDAGVVWAMGWTVLESMEAAADAGRAGEPGVGAALANGITSYLCAADAVRCGNPPAAVEAAVFESGGIFAVRSTGTTPVVANTSVPFVDFDNVSNQALWGLETTAASWAAATGASPILFYGSHEVGSPIDPDELSFGDLQFELNSFPDVDGFGSSNVHVGVCYETEIGLPHIGGDPTGPTLAEQLQREGTLLESHAVGCAGWWNTVAASSLRETLGDAVAFLGRAFLPQPLAASLMNDRRAPSTGGTPIDFSRFAPVAADPLGRLQFVEAPTDGYSDGALNTIVVEALSGAGTQVELVSVSLHLTGNNGIPAGASFCDPEVDGPCPSPTALTIESLNGYNTVAVFDNAQIWKPGGYTLCARGTLGGYTFEETCQVLHIKN